MENHHFSWVDPLQMAIFNSYVSLPEGIGFTASTGIEFKNPIHNPCNVPAITSDPMVKRSLGDVWYLRLTQYLQLINCVTAVNPINMDLFFWLHFRN